MQPILLSLGGLVVTPMASGYPDQSYSTSSEGVTEDRRSGGSNVKMVHFRKTIITISGRGDLPLGFSALNYNEPLELLCTAPRALIVAGLTGVIPTTTTAGVRPGVAPWALALVGNREISTPITMTGSAFEIAPRADASMYKVCWLPRFLVSCEPPEEAVQFGSLPFSWSITAREA